MAAAGGQRRGVALTQTHVLARAVVREAAERWPDWWDADLFGPPHREADLAVLEALRDGLRRLKLFRRRGRNLHATVRGRELAADPAALLRALASDLGGGDPFSETVAAAMIRVLSAGAPCTHAELVGPALAQVRRGRWHGPDGQPPTERDLSWTVGDVLSRGEAYGVIERRPDPREARRWRSRILLTAGGRIAFGVRDADGIEMPVLVFDAELLNVSGVSARRGAPDRRARRDPASLRLAGRPSLLLLAQRPVLGR